MPSSTVALALEIDGLPIIIISADVPSLIANFNLLSLLGNSVRNVQLTLQGFAESLLPNLSKSFMFTFE